MSVEEQAGQFPTDAPRSLLPVPYSLFSIPYSLIPVPRSPFPVPRSHPGLLNIISVSDNHTAAYLDLFVYIYKISSEFVVLLDRI